MTPVSKKPFESTARNGENVSNNIFSYTTIFAILSIKEYLLALTCFIHGYEVVWNVCIYQHVFTSHFY